MTALLNQLWFTPDTLSAEILKRTGVEIKVATLAKWRTLSTGPAYV
jgi:hypothetical protein